MRGLRAPLSLGSPHHGRVNNDIYELGPNGNQRIANRPAGATFGPCVVIRHPQAPGKKPWQDADEYRDWGQYVGHTRSVNGIDGGVGLGWNRWLYCDPSGASWIMRFEHTVNAADVTLQIWVDGIFGRFGREYPMSARLLASHTWVPELPSWNATDTVSGIVSQTIWGAQVQLALKEDGSQAYLHIYTSPGGVSGDSYRATSETGHDWGLLSGIALADIVRFEIAGTNTPDELAADLTATIHEDYSYDGGIVTSFDYTGPDIAHDVLLYKSPHGEVRRNWTWQNGSGNWTITLTVFGIVHAQSGSAPAPTYSSGNEVRMFAQNACYLATYQTGTPSNVFREVWFAQDFEHAAIKYNDNSRFDTWVTPNSGSHEMPNTRRQVSSFNLAQPGDNVVATNQYLTAFEGITFQYF